MVVCVLHVTSKGSRMVARYQESAQVVRMVVAKLFGYLCGPCGKVMTRYLGASARASASYVY